MHLAFDWVCWIDDRERGPGLEMHSRGHGNGEDKTHDTCATTNTQMARKDNIAGKEAATAQSRPDN